MNVVVPIPGPSGAPVVRRLIGFLRLLRDNGFPVGIAEALDAARMARGLDLSDRHGFRWALRTLLCASNSEWRRFDELYDLHWLCRGR